MKAIEANKIVKFGGLYNTNPVISVKEIFFL